MSNHDAAATATQSGASAEAGTASQQQDEAAIAQPGKSVAPGRTRASALYVYVVATAVLAIALVDFIAQNNRRVAVHFFGWDGHLSEAVALLIAAIIGALLVAVPGSIRVVQLRSRVRRANKR